MTGPRKSITLSVEWLLPTGEPTDHPFNGEPCVSVGISFEKPTPHESGGALLTGIKHIKALIDTGAQWNMIDCTLVQEAGSKPVETVMSYGVNGSSIITNHEISMMFFGKDSNMLHKTGAGTLDLRGRTVPYRMILGRKFLQMTRFRYDGVRGIKEIEVIHGMAGIL